MIHLISLRLLDGHAIEVAALILPNHSLRNLKG
jgi:hypothetical protein